MGEIHICDALTATRRFLVIQYLEASGDYNDAILCACDDPPESALGSRWEFVVPCREKSSSVYQCQNIWHHYPFSRWYNWPIKRRESLQRSRCMLSRKEVQLSQNIDVVFPHFAANPTLVEKVQRCIPIDLPRLVSCIYEDFLHRHAIFELEYVTEFNVVWLVPPAYVNEQRTENESKDSQFQCRDRKPLTVPTECRSCEENRLSNRDEPAAVSTATPVLLGSSYLVT